MNTFALINIAKKDLCLEEDDYRSLLKRVTGKDSLRAMTDGERRTVVAELQRRGFRRRSGKGKPKQSSKAYVRLIHALWRSVHQKGQIRDGSKAALRSFIRNRTGVTDPEWLTYDQASPVIEALKIMEARG